MCSAVLYGSTSSGAVGTRRSVEDASSSAAAAAASAASAAAASAAAAAYQSYEAEEYSYELNADGAGAGGMSGLLDSEERDGGSGIGGGLVRTLGSRPLTACGTSHCVFIRGQSRPRHYTGDDRTARLPVRASIWLVGWRRVHVLRALALTSEWLPAWLRAARAQTTAAPTKVEAMRRAASAQMKSPGRMPSSQMISACVSIETVTPLLLASL